VRFFIAAGAFALGSVNSDADLRAEPPASSAGELIEGKVLRCAQDFGSRLYAR
jgi:hypothetical protein